MAEEAKSSKRKGKKAQAVPLQKVHKFERADNLPTNLVHAMMSSGLPVEKLSHPDWISFVKKYSFWAEPTIESVLADLSNQQLVKFVARIGMQSLWLYVDELKNGDDKPYIFVITGVVGGNDEQGHLIYFKRLETLGNGKTIFNLIKQVVKNSVGEEDLEPRIRRFYIGKVSYAERLESLIQANDTDSNITVASPNDKEPFKKKIKKLYDRIRSSQVKSQSTNPQYPEDHLENVLKCEYNRDT